MMVLCYTVVIHQGTHQHRTKILQLFRKAKLNVRTFWLNDIEAIGVEEQ